MLTFRYLTVSLAATSADFGAFHLLGFCGEGLLDGAAALLSTGCGAWLSWTLHRRWVFAHSEVQMSAAGSRYLVGVLLCILLNAVAVTLLCDVVAFPRMLGRTIAALSVWAVLYWFNRRVVFRA